MERYSKIEIKRKREIVLLKAKPCAWGRCRFCDYINDNSNDIAAMNELNREVLSHVTGEYGVLEVIDSASCFELPLESLIAVKETIKRCNIHQLYLESHWIYRHRLDEMRKFFGIPIIFKVGVESFDNDFRENYLNKHADFKTAQEVAQYFDSPCIMVGIKGQTREMIVNDIATLKKYFKLGTVNVYTNNSTDVVRDPELIEWFTKEYSWLKDDPDIDILLENTDFGVGD